MNNSSIVACTAVALLAAKLITWHRKVRSLPPGPPKLPFIDNLHNIPAGMDWLQYAELAKRYNSDIIHLSALGNSIVVLNSFEAAQDLLEQKSAVYSGRPFSTMINELSGFNDLFVFSDYNSYWKASRRLFTKHFGGNKEIHQPRELFYVRRFLGHLLDTPEDFRQHIRHLVGSISISMTYGLNAQPFNDPYIALAEKVVTQGVEIFMSMHLVDVIPALKYVPSWVPGASFKSAAQNMRNLVARARNTLFEESRQHLENSVGSPSFVSEGLQDLDESQTPEGDLDMLKDVAAQVYLAAADTTTSALSTFVLAMICYPDVQKNLQRELDAALLGRLPQHEDLVSLPYLTAVIMEVLRWKPVTPIGNPHRTAADDVYQGYFIPKDSIILANQWAMSNHPGDYPDPSTFNPERFLKDGKIDESVRNPIDIAFGFGRRRCPGRHLALSTITIVAGSVLSVFDLSKTVDNHGNTVEPSLEYYKTPMSHPKDFCCNIQPRSHHPEELIVGWISTDSDNVL